MLQKTYAARGLLEFQMALTGSGAILRICFSGGSMGFNGVVAAKYTTDNPAIQRMIESSDHFKDGRVYLYSSEEVKKKRDDSKGETPAECQATLKDETSWIDRNPKPRKL